MGDRAGQGRAGSGGVYGRTMTAPASPSSWDLPSTDKAPFINACSSLPPQIPEGASLAMSLTDKKDTTLSRGNSSLLFPAADDQAGMLALSEGSLWLRMLEDAASPRSWHCGSDGSEHVLSSLLPLPHGAQGALPALKVFAPSISLPCWGVASNLCCESERKEESEATWF